MPQQTPASQAAQSLGARMLNERVRACMAFCHGQALPHPVTLTTVLDAMQSLATTRPGSKQHKEARRQAESLLQLFGRGVGG